VESDICEWKKVKFVTRLLLFIYMYNHSQMETDLSSKHNNQQKF